MIEAYLPVSKNPRILLANFPALPGTSDLSWLPPTQECGFREFANSIGWTYWHHLFTPRQLLMAGEYSRRLAGCEKQVRLALALIFPFGVFSQY